MINGPLPNADGFKSKVRDWFLRHSSECRVLRVSGNDSVYVSGQQDDTLYYIHTGLIKVLLPSPEYREYLVAMHPAGDLFGELCLAGCSDRLETAMAMEDCCLKQISACKFLASLRQEGLLEGLIRYLTVRLAEQQEVLTTLATLNSEHRLAWTLIQLARVVGQRQALGTRITKRISQEELAEMVGTTRTRIGIFMKRFREMGWVRLNPEHCLVIDNPRLEYFLDHRYTDEKELRRASGSLPPSSGTGTPQSDCPQDLDACVS